MISNFPPKKNYNPGGLQSFSFAPVVNLTGSPIIFEGSALSEIIFKAGFGFLKGYSTINTLQFSQETSENEHGIFYEQTLQGFVPIDTAESVSLFAEMVNMRFICLVKDYTNIKRLIGSFDNPLAFSYKYTSGNERKDARGYKFTFSRISSEAAPAYPF